MVITALPGSDGTDDQPYDKKRRSDMHFDLLDIIFSKGKDTASRNIRSHLRPYDRISRRLADQRRSWSIPFPDSAIAWLSEHMSREH
jgi:hypothetical protein